MRYRRRSYSRSYTPSTPYRSPSHSGSGANWTGEEVAYKFDRWSDFINACAAPTDFPEHSRHSRINGSSFTGCTPAEAVKLGQIGWMEGAAMARPFTNSLFKSIAAQIERQDIYYDVEGRMFDVARVLQNEPECWMQFETKIVKGPSQRFIRITINGTASGGVDTATIIGRGAAICALIELLEFSGRRVELTLAMATCSGSARFHARVKIKTFDQPLDMPKVVYAIAHPSVLRYHVFSLMEAIPDSAMRSKLGVGGGYGMPDDVHGDLGDIYLGRMMYGESQWTDPAKATEWIKTQLLAQGVELKKNPSAQ